MFYENQPVDRREQYKRMLSIFGNLSQLFSESDSPYLPYRAHENIFCKYFDADNLSRLDCSADAKKHNIGIGLKTWVGQDDQKVAEFGKLRADYVNLSEKEIVKEIAKYRNERIRVTMNIQNINELIYHIVKRVPGQMQIIEYPFDYIDIENIKIIKNKKQNNNIYFTDGKHKYHFSLSKHTLYMAFDGMKVIDRLFVDILSDPYAFLGNVHGIKEEEKLLVTEATKIKSEEQLCLRLYSTKANGDKVVYPKSGLNQWNASGRRRDPDEVYIPYPVKDQERSLNFFPDRQTVFNLTLPDGTRISAKVCQENGKAIMSNPNKDLGKWLLRDVFELSQGTLVTYKMLEVFGIDSVIFTKHSDTDYSVDFAEIGTYESFYSMDL